jgi:hypothetical protein
LPTDSFGPHYYNYAEGSIVDFNFPDSSSISILCGGNALLVLDSLYLSTDTVKVNGKVFSIRYFNKANNRYARQDYLNDFDILYQDVSLKRKDVFDSVFDFLEQNKKQSVSEMIK